LLGLPAADAAGGEPSESTTAWRQFIEAIAASRPLLLVVEDLHWADPALLEFLKDLVDRVTEADLLVVATARPELLERHPGWGGGLRNSVTVALPPLTDQDTARLVAALLGQSVLPLELQAVLLDRAGGNPLYAEEFVRLLTDRGLLNGDGMRALNGVELPLPDALQVLIAARLDTLGPERKALLQDAAVMGRVFWSGALAAMGGVDERQVRTEMHELQRKELIRSIRASSVEHQAEYAFWHALVRDVAYAQIPRSGRARRHRLAAEWIQDLAGHRVGDRAELIAHHYTQALALTRAARGSPAEIAELEEPARRFLQLGGDRAVNLDLGRARALYAQALELCPGGHPERGALLAKLAEATFQTGAHEQAKVGFEAAVAAFEGMGDRLGAGSALVSLAGVLWNLGDPAASRTRLTDAIALLEREPPGPQLAHAYAELAAHRLDAGSFEEGAMWAQRSLFLAEEGGAVEQRLRALGYRGVARCSLGEAAGLDDLRAALRLALDAGLAYHAGQWYANLGNSLGDFDPSAGLAAFREGIQFAERRGLTELAMWMRGGTLERLFEVGRWDDLLHQATEIGAWYRAHGPESFIILATDLQTARVLAFRGQHAAADELVERSLLVTDAPYMDRLMTLTVAALVKQARNEPAAAARQVEGFHKVASGRPRWGRARFLPDLVRVCAAARRPALARSLLAGFSLADTPTGQERRSLLTATALMAEAQDQADAAAGLYAEASNGWEASGHVLEHGQALLGWGCCLHRLERPEEAAPRLRQARALFGTLGCRLLAAEADAWIHKTTAATS
jgi:tetratricopeptide (TPR) repeat protein